MNSCKIEDFWHDCICQAAKESFQTKMIQNISCKCLMPVLIITKGTQGIIFNFYLFDCMAK